MALEGKLEKGDPRWGEFNRSFRNLELEPADIAHLIRTGHAYTCWLKDGWRCRDNFQSAQFIPLDMDTEDGPGAFSNWLSTIKSGHVRRPPAHDLQPYPLATASSCFWTNP